MNMAETPVPTPVSSPTGTSAGAAPAVPPAGAPPVYAVQRDLHLLDRLSALHRHRRGILVVFVLVVSWMMVDTYTTTPMYRAQARILIEEEHSELPTDFKDALVHQDPEPYYQTQYRVLKGRDLARRAVRKLRLQDVPEFNGQGPKPTPVKATLSRLKQGAMGPIRRMLGRGAPAPMRPVARDAGDDSRLVGAFLGRVTVEPVRSSRLVDLYFDSSDAQFAATAVNALAEEYVDQNLEFTLASTQKSLEWLAQEVQRQQQVAQASERALAEYREQQNAISLDDHQKIVVTRLNQLYDSVTRAKTERMQKEGLWNQVRNGDPDTIAAVIQNTFVATLKGRRAELQRDRMRLSERYGEKHPEIVKINADIENARRQLEVETQKAVRVVRNEYEAALAQERTLTQALEEQKGAAMDLNRKSIDYTVLERDAASSREVYNSLLQREKELRVISSSRANNVRLMDRAEVPGGPFTPNPRRDWMMAIFFGLIFSIGYALALDYLDDTVKTPEDITRRLKLHFLGLVPIVRGDQYPLISGSVPHDFGEAFRTLRTSLVSLNPGQGPKIVAITSAQPLEGKTTTAVNIAVALAVGGARVLLVDADMRRPSLHRTLRVSNDRGLSHLLTGEARMREVVQRTEDPNLLAIAGGRTPSNPSELLGSDRMRTFVASLESSPFDWVIIDTPPVLAVTDAVILAPLVHGVTFVVGAEMTRWRLAERAIETIVAARPRTISAVLNKVDFARNKYYYARYYGHQYKNCYVEAPAA